MKHTLIIDHGYRKHGKKLKPQARCSCGKWNCFLNTDSELDMYKYWERFNFHLAQIGELHS